MKRRAAKQLMNVQFPPNGHSLPQHFFVATGTKLPSVEAFSGVLIKNGKLVSQGILLREFELRWNMAFPDINESGSGYQLRFCDCISGAMLCEVLNLTVHQVNGNRKKKSTYGSITITSPSGTPPIDVATTFTVSGETDVTTALSASAIDNATITYLWGPPTTPGSFAFEYANVAVGGPYTVTISGAGAEPKSIQVQVS